jgi:HAD superfamily hydrolase (TIGR01509 family)
VESEPQTTTGALIFDLDGTLVDTVGHRIAAWVQALVEAEIPASSVTVAPLIGMGGRDLATAIARHGGIDLNARRLEGLERRAGAIFSERNRRPRPLPGIRDVLTSLVALGKPWAIATGGLQDEAQPSIECLRLPSRPIVIDGTLVARGKPAPDLLLLAADRLRIPPGECRYIGDSTWDMLAAAAAKMASIGVTAGGVASADALKAAGAGRVFANLTEFWRSMGGP